MVTARYNAHKRMYALPKRVFFQVLHEMRRYASRNSQRLLAEGWRTRYPVVVTGEKSQYWMNVKTVEGEKRTLVEMEINRENVVFQMHSVQDIPVNPQDLEEIVKSHGGSRAMVRNT